MKNLKHTFKLLVAALFLFTSCSNDNDPVNNNCDENYVGTAILTAFSSANGYDDGEWMDLYTHEYSVEINADGEICSIGYQNPSAWTGNYIMEIINVTTGDSYNGIHTFSQSQTDYQAITPVAVNSGDIIKVKRTITGSFTTAMEIVGRLLARTDGNPIIYPITEGNLTFLSSDFYGSGGPALNAAQPYIPFGFMEY